MSNLNIIRVPLSKDEITALQNVAKIECRLDYEQIRFALRTYLIRAGALTDTEIFCPDAIVPPKGAIS
jgi:hypothetical protein